MSHSNLASGEPQLIAPAPTRQRGLPANTPTARHKRQTIIAACEPCRKRKSKCDGHRPICAACATRENACRWDVEAGETRHSMMRLQKEKLEKELSTMQDTLLRLRTGSYAEAEALLRRLRNDEDNATPWTRAFEDSASNPGRSSFSQMGSMSPRSERRNEPRTFGSSASREGVLSPVLTAPSRPVTSSTGPLSYPPEAVTSACILKFYECAGHLFHIVQHDTCLKFFDLVYSHGGTPDPLTTATLFCIMALGCQYADDEDSFMWANKSYQIAQTQLEFILATDVLGSIRTLTLLAYFNVMGKSTLALSYIELALGLGRRADLTAKQRPEYYTEEVWLDMKRVWRTLIFFDTWLCSTLGYNSQWNDIPTVDLLAAMELGATTSPKEILAEEMAKVSILTSRVVRFLYDPKGFNLGVAASAISELRARYKALPAFIQPEGLLMEEIPRQTAVASAFVMMLYNGAIMLLYRKALFDSAHQVDLLNVMAEDGAIRDSNLCAMEGMAAAKSSATILINLHSQNLLYRRCWLIIAQAFSSAAILLQHVLTSTSRQDVSKALLDESVTLIDGCIDVLKYCGLVDQAAARLLTCLKPCYQAVLNKRGTHFRDDERQARSILDDNNPAFLVRPPQMDPSALAQELVMLVRRPFNKLQTWLEIEMRAIARPPPLTPVGSDASNWVAEVVTPFNLGVLGKTETAIDVMDGLTVGALRRLDAAIPAGTCTG